MYYLCFNYMYVYLFHRRKSLQVYLFHRKRLM